MSTLTISDVIDIRRNHANGFTSTELAGDYGVDARTIRKVVSGERWSSVPQDKTIKGYSNYDITADGRVYSHAKRDYLVTTEVNGVEQVRLSKTANNGSRVHARFSVSELVDSHFG